MSRCPLVIAHRGASNAAPENTVPALAAAVAAGADAIEIDLQTTADGRVIVFHDESLDRTTNGSGLVAEASYCDVALLDAGSWFGARFARTRVPLLTEALGVVPYPVELILELKPVGGARLAASVLEIVAGAKLAPRVWVSCSDPDLLGAFADYGIRTALVAYALPGESTAAAVDRTIGAATGAGCVAWHPEHSIVTERAIRRAHDLDLQVAPWTVDDPSSQRRLARWSVDAVFTNDPVALRRRWPRRGLTPARPA